MALTFDLAVDVFDSEGTQVQLGLVPPDVLQTKHLYSVKVPAHELSMKELCGRRCPLPRVPELAKRKVSA